MKYFVSSETKCDEATTLEEIVYLLNHELDTEEFVVVKRQNLANPKIQNYIQTTTNTGDEHLFWLEARQYHRDNSKNFSHYRQKFDNLEPIIQAFSTFMTEQENYQNWEDVTAEFH